MAWRRFLWWELCCSGLGGAPLSLFHLEVLLWFPQLAMQIASKAGVESSDSEMKALRCHGNVHSTERDEKELRGWVFSTRGDRQFTGRFPSSFFESMELWTAPASVPNSYI